MISYISNEQHIACQQYHDIAEIYIGYHQRLLKQEQVISELIGKSDPFLTEIMHHLQVEMDIRGYLQRRLEFYNQSKNFLAKAVKEKFPKAIL